MSSYIDQSLAKNEHVLETFEFHWIVYLKPILRSLFVLLVFCAVSYYWQFNVYVFLVAVILVLFSTGVPFLNIVSTEMGVTNKRLILKTGVLARNSEEMRISSIETVEVRQSMIQRIFGYGLVKITGKGVSDLFFNKVADPMAVKVAIENAIPAQEEETAQD